METTLSPLQTYQPTWIEVKKLRNVMLAESDWTQFNDSPLTESQKQAWAAYRQALRDVPQTFSNINEVVWPVKPS